MQSHALGLHMTDEQLLALHAEWVSVSAAAAAVDAVRGHDRRDGWVPPLTASSFFRVASLLQGRRERRWLCVIPGVCSGGSSPAGQSAGVPEHRGR